MNTAVVVVVGALTFVGAACMTISAVITGIRHLRAKKLPDVVEQLKGPDRTDYT